MDSILDIQRGGGSMIFFVNKEYLISSHGTTKRPHKAGRRQNGWPKYQRADMKQQTANKLLLLSAPNVTIYARL